MKKKPGLAHLYYFIVNEPLSGSFSFFFVFSIQLTLTVNVQYNFCR